MRRGARHAAAASLAASAPPSPLPLGVNQRRKVGDDALASPRGLADAGRGARWSATQARAVGGSGAGWLAGLANGPKAAVGRLVGWQPV
jgi:hypothetical protein